MKYVRFIAVITISLVSVLPSLLLAAETDYIPLVGIPGLNDPGNMTTENYINALYVIAISVAAFMAVVKLIFAGVKYIATDIVPGKEQAKKDIQNAIIGLLIVIGAVLILETINPQLTNLDALSKLEMIDVTVQDVVVVSTGFVSHEPEIIGTSINLDTSSPEAFASFETSCPGTIVTTVNSAGQNMATCTTGSDAPVDTDLVAASPFTPSDQDILALFELRNSNNRIASQIGTTIYPNDVKGLLTIEEIPGDDEYAFAISLQLNCEKVGGSHVANSFYGGQYEFWCVGSVSN